MLDGIDRVALICRDKVDSNPEYSHTCLDTVHMGPGANHSACRSASGDAGPITDTSEWPLGTPLSVRERTIDYAGSRALAG